MMSEAEKKKTERPSYEVVRDITFKDYDENEAVYERDRLRAAHPDPARVRMRRLRDGSLRVWVRVPKIKRKETDDGAGQ